VKLNPRGFGQFPHKDTMSDKTIYSPFPPGKMVKPVNFHFNALNAQSVCLMGDFNGWNPTSHPLRRRVDGCWSIEVLLPHGHHRYQFLVDHKPVLDPQGTGIARNDRNERVSLLAVS
jgi:1,4-alpha-glucan branching enzyme